MSNRGLVLPWLNSSLEYESDDCLIFPFGKFADGYGCVWVDGKMMKAHRWVCTAVNGPDASGMKHAAHSCGNRICVNKRHLRWATRSENEADKIIHGRSNRGERQGSSILSRDQVLKIRSSKQVQRTLAKQLGVSEQSISSIKSRRSWSWL